MEEVMSKREYDLRRKIEVISFRLLDLRQQKERQFISENEKKHLEYKEAELNMALENAMEDLKIITQGKPENVEKRKKEEEKRNEENLKMAKEQLDQERLEHEKSYNEDLYALIECLKATGVDELKAVARRLADLRFAYKNAKDDFIRDEIDLRVKETANKNARWGRDDVTTKKEKREIKKNVILLTKKATRMAKRYKELYFFMSKASFIMEDLRDKGLWPINWQNGGDAALKAYFTQPTKNVDIGYGRYMSMPNEGYEMLGFVRDYDSKYNEDVRRRRI